MTERIFPGVKFDDDPERMLKDAKMVCGVDNAKADGDFTAAIGGYTTPDGAFHIQEVSLVKHSAQQHTTFYAKTKTANHD